MFAPDKAKGLATAMPKDIRPAELIRRLNQVLSALYAERHPGGPTIPQISLLAELANGPKTCRQLSAATGMDQSTAFATMTRLWRQEMVKKAGEGQRERPAGRLPETFALTKAGRHALHKAQSELQMAEVLVMNRVDCQERSGFLDAMRAAASPAGQS